MQNEETSVDITPESMKTPEGRARVNAAMVRFTSATAEVANLAGALLEDWASELAIAMNGHDGEFGADLDEVLRAIQSREEAQEEMLRAMAGR